MKIEFNFRDLILWVVSPAFCIVIASLTFCLTPKSWPVLIVLYGGFFLSAIVSSWKQDVEEAIQGMVRPDVFFPLILLVFVVWLVTSLLGLDLSPYFAYSCRLFPFSIPVLGP